MSFQRFNRAEDVIENQRTIVTSGMWSGGSTKLTTNFFTLATQGASTASFVEVSSKA